MIPAGSAGTAGRNYKVEPPAGKHRAPPTPPPPDRWTAPIAAAAAILTAASLIAVYAPGLAPDATAAGRHGVAVSTAARSARTVSVPLEILPATTPTIGASGAWDPETDAPIPVGNALSRPQSFAGVSATATTVPKPAQATTGLSSSTPAPTNTTQTTPTTAQASRTTVTRTTTTSSPPSTTAAATSSATPTTEATVTPTRSAEPTPTDIGDVIDEALGTEETP